MPLKIAEKNYYTERLSSHLMAEDSDFDEIRYDPKKKVECICPKCGQKHKMAFHWIGRGTPRKYCALCKVSNY